MQTPPRSKFQLPPLRWPAVLVALGAMLVLLPAQAARLALVVGNDNYDAIPKLRNAGADVDAMAKALRKAGFAVTDLKNRNLRQMKDDVRQFRDRVRGGDEVVLFFSGHGVQIDGMNYLLPVDVRSSSEGQVRDDALALSQVLEDLRQQRPALTLAIVDACRDNPFKGNGRSIGGRGLTRVAGATGQMVIYSAGEGQQALDSLGERDPVRNGVFTRVFVKEMEQRGATIDQVARNVREEVYRLAQNVKHEQVPAIYDQVLGRFYFYAPGPVAAPPAAASVVPVVASSVAPSAVPSPEMVLWNSIKESRDPGELNAYLDKYPKGQFAEQVRERLSSLAPAPVRQSAVACKTLLRDEHKRWVAGGTAKFSGYFFEITGYAARQAVAKQLSQQLGFAVKKPESDTSRGYLGADFLKKRAGCVAYQETMFGSRQGAQCVADLLGEGYRVGGCEASGFPYTLYTNSPQ
ncbi:MAG: caspase family protein [Pseudomonadota bacterium]